LFNSVPLGTQVRVVNQPFVFGWHDGQLYMQAFDVLEDDTRGWKKAPKKLLSQSLAANLQKQLKAHNEQVNWDEVTVLSHDPRGVPVPISLADVSLDQVLASASKVQNHLPDGSTWDGKSDLPMDEATFQQMVSEIEPGSSGGAPAASRAAPASAATPGSTTPAGSTSPAGSTAPAGGATPAGSTTPARPGNTATSSPSTTPTTSAPVVKPRAPGPPVTSAAGSQSKSTQ